MKYADDFMGWVELHEHSWATERYPERPALEEIMNSPVVTFWLLAKQDKHLRYKVKLYKDLHEVERYFTKLVLRSNIELPQDRLARIFFYRKRYIVAGVKMIFREVEK